MVKRTESNSVYDTSNYINNILSSHYLNFINIIFSNNYHNVPIPNIYKKIMSDTSQTGDQAGVIAASVIGVLILIATVIVLCFVFCQSR